ncbi:MAG TPA: HNH endonuclease [Verrucomicrobiae bacterium]|nr:HNH endonuclease [Verrucomicrobiae bacterium]
MEHIIAKQHGGPDDADNLALACHRCNLRKGPNLTGIDPQTAEVARPSQPTSSASLLGCTSTLPLAPDSSSR